MTRWAICVGRCWVVLGLGFERQNRGSKRPLLVVWLRLPSPTSVHWTRIAAVLRFKLGENSLPPRMLN